MNKNTRLELTDNPISAVMKIAEGNPGAMTVCLECFSRTSSIDPDSIFSGYTCLFDLDSLGIYASKVWILFRDVCGSDYIAFHAVLRANQLGILPTAELLAAVETERPLDTETIIAKVQERLPKFGRMDGTTSSE